MTTDLIETLSDSELTRDPSADYNKIMVPVDMRHTSHSEKALAMAVALCRQFGAKFHLLTVQFPLEDSIAYDPNRHRKEFEFFANRFGKLNEIDVHPEFRVHEKTKSTILSAAKDLEIDLIVMASHNPSLRDYVFRSKASDIALRFHGSVLVVR